MGLKSALYDCLVSIAATIYLKVQPTSRSTQYYFYITTTTILQPFFRDHTGEPVPEENFWTLWCKGRLTEADALTIQLGATPSRPTSAHLHHPPIFYRLDALPAAQPIVSKTEGTISALIVLNNNNKNACTYSAIGITTLSLPKSTKLQLTITAPGNYNKLEIPANNISVLKFSRSS